MCNNVYISHIEKTPKGWFGIAYDTTYTLEEWMRNSFVGEYECILRFNSGSPAYFFHMYDEADFILFKLTYL